MTEQELTEAKIGKLNSNEPTRFMKPTREPVPKIMLDVFRTRFELQVAIVTFKNYVTFQNRCQRYFTIELPEKFYVDCVSDDNIYREEEFHNSMMRLFNHAKDVVITVKEIEPTMREKLDELLAKELKNLKI